MCSYVCCVPIPDNYVCMYYLPCVNGAMLLTVFIAVITANTLEVVIGRVSC